MVIFRRNKLLTLCCLSLSANSANAAYGETINGHFGVTTNQINRDIGDVPGNRSNADLRFTYYENKPDSLELKFDTSALINDQSLIMYSVQEVYVAKKGLFRSYDETSKRGDLLRFGRQVLDWSDVDATWSLGKLNNRKNFDFFDPQQEGLIGLNYENRSKNGVFWKVFGSGLYVPETNPSLDIDKSKKTITSRNPWADPPASSTETSPGVDTPIRYNVDYPEISEVIFRYSIGASVGVKTEHWLSNVFMIRKPENQISTKVNIVIPNSSEFVDAFIKPEFYYHDVFGGNIKYFNNDVEVYVGGIGIFPNTFPDGDQEATDATELKTEKRREAYLAGGISKTNDLYSAGFNYIARVSPYDRDADSLASDPRWNQALNFFASRNFKSKFKVMGDIKYDMLTTDRLVMLRGGYLATKHLLLTLGLNMIGTPNNGKSYWSPFTNNDALLVGLRYVY